MHFRYVVANCGNPPCPANGMVSTNGGTTFGHMATYSCKQGYQLSGPSSRFCLWSGSWSGSTPTCDPIRKLYNKVFTFKEKLEQKRR